MNTDEFRAWLALAAIPAIVAVLVALGILFCRERIKECLREKLAQPIDVRWRPFAFPLGAGTFDVLYIDFTGLVHRAHCRFRGCGFPRDLQWLDDEVIGCSSHVPL